MICGRSRRIEEDVECARLEHSRAPILYLEETKHVKF